MVLITDKFWGPSGAETVIGSVHLWLAEAINTLQDNKDTLTAKVGTHGHHGPGGPRCGPHRAPPAPLCVFQVIQGCGNPRVNPQSPGPEESRRRGKLVLQEKPPTGILTRLVSACPAVPAPCMAQARPPQLPSALPAVLQVSDAKVRLRDAQDFWISLPGTLCSERMAVSAGSDDRCWNGMAKGRYVPVWPRLP